jgi:hypothetical protein
MKVIATPIKCKDLKPGDLFSTVDQIYWDAVKDDRVVGERVYIRTNNPCPKDQEEDDINLIQIIKE